MFSLLGYHEFSLKTFWAHECIHKDDFIELFCANCNKANPRLTGIVINYGLCTKDLNRRGRMELVGDYLWLSMIWENPPSIPRSRRCVPSSGAPYLTTREEVDLPVTITALLEWSVCHEQFKSGLGEHIRHKHLSLANERRIQARKADIERKRAARAISKYWWQCQPTLN